MRNYVIPEKYHNFHPGLALSGKEHLSETEFQSSDGEVEAGDED